MVVDLLGDANLLADFGDRNTLVDVDLDLSQLIDDLLGEKVFFATYPPFFCLNLLTL